MTTNQGKKIFVVIRIIGIIMIIVGALIFVFGSISMVSGGISIGDSIFEMIFIPMGGFIVIFIGIILHKIGRRKMLTSTKSGHYAFGAPTENKEGNSNIIFGAPTEKKEGLENSNQLIPHLDTTPRNMITCESCGSINDNDAIFCDKCGVNL